MKIRYENVSKEITAIDAPDWMESDGNQTVIDIGDVAVPSEPISWFRFGTKDAPFVNIKPELDAEENAKKSAKKSKKEAILAKLKITEQEWNDLINSI